MNVLELPEVSETPLFHAPDWVCGCFLRRSITFFDGRTDVTTQVVWIQSRGLTFDLRLAPGRPRLASLDELGSLSVEARVLLAEAEGGIARSTFTPSHREHTGTMDWGDWVRAQVHDGWPEPGELRRAGDCLIEFAPSGAYVEEWRVQPSAAGRLIGLSLLTETCVETGAVLHVGGGVVVAGDHAGFVRGRPAPLPPAARLTELVRAHGRDAALLRNVFAVEASYATRDAEGHYVVTASTLPFREGTTLSLDGFSVDMGGGVLQRTEDGGRLVERRFRVDTSAAFSGALATRADPAASRWLEAEAATLLRNAR